MSIITLSDGAFDETINGSDTPVLVDFWAEWCGPCKMIAPVLEQIAKEQDGKITIGKLNVDDNPDTARRYEVMSIPTLMVFNNGSLEKRLVGARSKGQLMAELAQFIGGEVTKEPPLPEPFRILAPGTEGEAVRDLQQRLADLGFETASAAEAGTYGDSTAAAIRAFQTARGLRVDGVCGRQTWSSLVEAGYRLGDRLLYHRTPMLRGDDVLDLQEKLNALGFDAGRGDGIFGPHTTDALREFQRNVGAVIDGICGPESVAALERLSRFGGGSVASVREKEALRDGALRLAGRRVYLAVEPGLDALGEVVAKGLMELGADVLVDGSGEDDSVVATEANRYGADLFLGVRFGDIPGLSCDYFASHASRSEGGCHVAHCISEELAKALDYPPTEPTGRAYAVLRETRMPAVVCQPVQADDVEGVRRLVVRVGPAGRAIVHGVQRGVEEPL